MKNNIFLFLFLISASIWGQNVLDVHMNDIVSLTTDYVEGSVQWQKSNDLIEWNDIEGATEFSYAHTVKVLPVYFRAKIDNTCNNSFSEVLAVVLRKDPDSHPSPNLNLEEDNVSYTEFSVQETSFVDPNLNLDTDGDGIPDRKDNCTDISNPNQSDLDNDGIGDVCDPDKDGDGVPDQEDAPFVDPNLNLDTDGDGIPDRKDNCTDISNPNQSDLDNDGIGDVCDPDKDGDGVPDQEDAPFVDPNLNLDTDGDGIPDRKDNCTDISNPNQSDLDNDGIGDVCDPDKDGDGIPNAEDNCADISNPNQSDLDQDGIGDVCDEDDQQATLLWSDPNTWPNNTLPVEGEMVTIPEGEHIILDIDTPALGGLIIRGTLEFKRENIRLAATYIGIIGGELRIGTAESPFLQKAIITLNDTNTNANLMGSMGTRGIVVMNGGVLNVHGQSPAIAWTKLGQHAPDGSTSITLSERVSWQPGDEVIIGPTDFYGAANGKSITQKFEILNGSGVNFSLNAPLEAQHWGLLQYATTNGMSLRSENIIPTPTGNFLYGIKPNNPKQLDQRAPVGNLTRNIVIQSPDDQRWREEGFGVHIMIMPSSKAYIDGIEIKRGGQRGRLRRYPIHWHMLSYEGSRTLPDAEGQFLMNSTINESENRGIVVHGTNGVLVKNNIVYKVKGHGVFTENAAERRNIFDHNLVLHVRNPEPSDALKQHELPAFRRGSSGFWISNPDNITVNNHVGDCQGTGFWLAFPEKPFGDCKNVVYDDGQIMNPRRMEFGQFDNNTAHSCKGSGLHNDNPEVNEAGATEGGRTLKDYSSDLSGRDSKWPFRTRRRFFVRQFHTWKNNHGIWDRANWVNTLEVVAADNKEKCFAGSGEEGLIIGCLVIGRSLNSNMNGTTRPYVPSAFASYHHTFDLQGNIIVDFPLTKGRSSGVFSTDDYYLRPIENGHILSIGNIVIKSHPGTKLTASEAWGSNRVSPTNPHFNLAGAIWDPQGFWGPKNSYFVYDDPFYTYGLQKMTVAPSSSESGGVSVSGPFYGFDSFRLNSGGGLDENQHMALEITRYTNAFQEVGTLKLAGRRDGISNLLPNMRDFAAHKSGIFEIKFPDHSNPNRVQIGTVINFFEESDQVVIAVEFNGTRTASVKTSQSFSNGARVLSTYTKLNSRSEVINSNGETYWQDRSTNRVWIKVRGGRVSTASTNPRNIPYAAFELIIE